MEVLGKGVFTWDGFERRSERYGSFFLADSSYEGFGKMVPETNQDLAQRLTGKRVHVVVRILETRKSGHVGDLFHGIFPSTPAVGEIIDLGVGIFGTETDPDIGGHPRYSLQPGDQRDIMWLDPYKLYRCHDQTVEVLAEETEADFSEAPKIAEATKGAISNGDGSYQLKSKRTEGVVIVNRKIVNLGDGMFMVGGPEMGPRGTFHPTDETPRKKRS